MTVSDILNRIPGCRCKSVQAMPCQTYDSYVTMRRRGLEPTPLHVELIAMKHLPQQVTIPLNPRVSMLDGLLGEV